MSCKTASVVLLNRFSRHYLVESIRGRHFIQTAERAGLSSTIAKAALEEVSRDAEKAISVVEKQLSQDFPEKLYLSVRKGLLNRLTRI